LHLVHGGPTPFGSDHVKHAGLVGAVGFTLERRAVILAKVQNLESWLVAADVGTGERNGVRVAVAVGPVSARHLDGIDVGQRLKLGLHARRAPVPHNATRVTSGRGRRRDFSVELESEASHRVVEGGTIVIHVDGL